MIKSQELGVGRQDAVALDARDPLRGFRERFVGVDDGTVYLDGNSLGRLPHATLTRLESVVGLEWGSRVVRAWDEGWLDFPVVIGDLLGSAVVAAAAGQVVVGDSTTVCFYKLASAALDLRPGRSEIVADVDNFPTDRYVIEGLAAARGLTVRWLRFDPCLGPDAVAVGEAVSDRTALVAFSHVSYRSAFVAPMADVTAAAHGAGALILWDLSHSAGSVPVALDADGVDLAVGCTYKYLNGGPGAPAYMYVRRSLQDDVRQPIWGWLGRRDPFAMEQGFEVADGVRGLLSGTPPVLSLVAVEEGVRLVEEAGIERIRAKGIALTSLAVALIDARLAGLGASVASPRDSTVRGAHVALAHPDAASLCQRLIERGVIVDFRRPDVIRLGLSPLTTRFVDVWDAVEAVRDLLAEG
jgi:kynureninase